MVKLFWKKLTVLNIGLLITIIRLYGLFLSKIEKYKNNSSVFPSEDENGYPFFDQISCNLKQLFLISNFMGNNSNVQDQNFPKLYEKNEKCNFISRVNICKANKNCHNNLLNVDNYTFNTTGIYHLKENMTGIMFWNEIYNSNNFNNVEMTFMYRVISGYHSYVNLMIYKNDFEKIKEKVAFSYEYLNNLFYLHSLLLKSSNIIEISYNNYNMTFLNQYTKQCLYLSEDNIDKISNDYKQKIFIVLNRIRNIIYCIKHQQSKYSSQIDIQSLTTMFKILFKIPITQEEKETFIIFANKFYKAVSNLFEADYYYKETSNRYKDYQAYFIIGFCGLSLTVMLFVNNYFIKHREYYEEGGRFFSKSNPKRRYEMNRLKQNLINQEKIKRINDNLSRGIPYDSFTDEEKEMIDKLTNSNPTGNANFVVTK